jgi:serine protease AprX
MIKKYIFLLCFVLGSTAAFTQNHWVFLKDKGPDGEANNLDAPVYDRYKKKLVRNKDVSVIGYSKWLNAACVEGDVSALSKRRYVSHTQSLTKYNVSKEFESIDTSRYGSADVQLQMLGLDQYHQMGYTGEGVVIGVFDAGFRKLNAFKAFDSMWTRGQILANYDFVRKDTLKYNTSMHGTSVLSIMGIDYPDTLTGAAPHASFVLARTEDAATETHVEEYNWIKALEWADSVGVDIIHSSLGYSLFDSGHFSYTYADMDGKTSLITLATDIATSKGIFVTNSAGNSGAKPWKFITAPCDGERVLCVGAVDSFNIKADFSSYGPSSDGRVKPEVMAMGKNTAHISSGGRLRFGNGTSFSGPMIAGMVACMMQANPNATNDHIFEAIIRSADRYNQPDSGYGYGIPNVMYADTILKAIRLGYQNTELFPIKVYPNPATNLVSIESSMPISKIEIYSSTMQEVKNARVHHRSSVLHDVSLANINSGIYFVRLHTNRGIITKKLLVVK